ncbi:MAG: DUF423 domain-containing protein [Oligoflexales bacterium]
MNHLFIFIGCISSGLSVALGAFAAHGLRQIISAASLQTFETGVRYQMYHSLALLFIGIYANENSSKAITIAGWSFIGGLLLFSGSLYGLALGGPRILGPITPIGGLLWLLAWALAAIACWQKLTQ